MDHLKVIGSESSSLRSLKYKIFDKSIDDAVISAEEKSKEFNIFKLPDHCHEVVSGQILVVEGIYLIVILKKITLTIHLSIVIHSIIFLKIQINF